MADHQAYVDVLDGVDDASGMTWRVRTRVPGPGTMITMVERGRDGRRASSGFAGPPLPPDTPVNCWHGAADDFAAMVCVRAAPEVTALIAFAASGYTYKMSMSEVVTQFGLKFAALVVPGQEEITEVRAYVDPTRFFSASLRSPGDGKIGQWDTIVRGA